MDSQLNSFYPTRAFIRFRAKHQLVADLTGQEVTTFVQRDGGAMGDVTVMVPSRFGRDRDLRSTGGDQSSNQKSNLNVSADLAAGLNDWDWDAEPLFDEALLNEVASIAFHPEQHPELYQPCGSRQAAERIELAIATEIVETYKQFLRNQKDATIQQLNSLL